MIDSKSGSPLWQRGYLIANNSENEAIHNIIINSYKKAEDVSDTYLRHINLNLSNNLFLPLATQKKIVNELNFGESVLINCKDLQLLESYLAKDDILYGPRLRIQKHYDKLKAKI